MSRAEESGYVEQFRERYSPYQMGKGGSWYILECTDLLSEPALQYVATHPAFVWVNPSGSNLPADAISPQMLADLALAHTTLPTREVSVNPAAASFVNFPTWVWATDADTPVSVTASLGPLSATVTATPAGLTLDPGTRDADLHPTNGQCTGVGVPYIQGVSDAEAIPECGVTYLRSTAARPEGYPLRAQTRWDITWSSSTGAGGTLPAATTSSTTPIQVGEIQTIVTGTR